MFAVISHFPTEDINCPGIEAGPPAETKEAAIDAWKELQLTAYPEGGTKDPKWSEDQPDSTEGRILDIASGLHAKVAAGHKGVIFEPGNGQQAYLVELPAAATPTASVDRPANVGLHVTLSQDRLDSHTTVTLAAHDTSGWANGLCIRSDDFTFSIAVPDRSYFYEDGYSPEDYFAIPKCLRDCFNIARANGASWIHFSQFPVSEEAGGGSAAIGNSSHIFQYADLSTSHLDAHTAETLSNPSASDSWVETVIYMSRDCGWFVHVPTDYIDDAWYAEIPESLRHCFEFARKNNASWILFDRDGCHTTQLPTYDW